MKIAFICTVILLFNLAKANDKKRSSGISCNQVWKSYSDGEFHDNAVDTGNGELVVRVQVDSKWISGRLSTSDKKAYIPTQTGSVEYSSYEVLVGTTGCQTQWVVVEPESDLSQTHAVNSGSGQFVARGEHDGYILGGSAVNAGLLRIAYEGTTHDINIQFEVLVSSYPALYAEVSDYTFQEDDLVDLEERGVLKLIGMEQIENLSEGIQSTKHSIHHEQSIEEFFEISEEHQWKGVQTVSQTLLLWFGSPIVAGQFDVTSSKIITTNRNRILEVSKELVFSNTSNVNVCSYAFMVTTAIDTKIRYSAIGKFFGDQMSGTQVKYVLETAGRDVINVVGDAVWATVEGTVSGKFALRIRSRIEDNDSSGAPCLEYAREFNGDQRTARALYV